MSELLNACRFNPVQCTDAIFQTLAPVEGNLYFVTDKKKMYLGKNGKKIPMCASSGFFYGIKDIHYDNNGITPDPNVIFDALTEVEGEDVPEIDDLILNKDGCFYRVISVEDNTLGTTRLTLQGTGIGGGDGPGSGTGSSEFTLQIVGPNTKIYSSTAKNMKVSFICRYKGTDINNISQVSFTRAGDEEPFYTHTVQMAFNQEQSIDLHDYMHLFNTTTKAVTMVVQDLYGFERSVQFKIQLVTLALTATMPNLLSATESTFGYTCSLAGGTVGVTNKRMIYEFYNESNMVDPVLKIEPNPLNTAEEGSITTNLVLNTLAHGVYVLHITACADISSSESIYSNTLVHKIARFDSAVGTPLLMIKLPAVTEQYTNIPMDYLLMSSEAGKTYTLELKLNGESKTQLSIVTNQSGTYNLYFEDKSTYALLCTILELAISYSTLLTIAPYTGNLPVINPNRDDLILYLNPRGKSNDSVDRNIWTEYNNRYTAQLSGLHYGTANGWLMDADGTSYLKLSSGASLSLNEFKPFASDPSKVQGMTIELDFEVSGVLDYDTELIKCISTDKDGVVYVGFSITGDRFRFYNSRLNGSLDENGRSTSLASLNLVEGKRTRISFVIEPNNGSIEFPMCYSYLNGILSGAVIYDKDDNYKDSSDNPARLQINAANAEIKIYSIRVYTTALNDKVILNNFTASLPTLEERQARYDINNVYNGSTGLVDYILVSADEYGLQVPYMKITGGWSTEAESKWQLKDQTSIGQPGLPTGKKDYKMIEVEVKYPKAKDNPYFTGYNDYKCVTKFASGKPMSQAYGEKPTEGGAIMYAQGTSSMEYPVKNLRIRFKEDDDFYVVRNDIAPVEIICMKADYMESSGSHNTGAANLVDALYKGTGIQTPGQAHQWEHGKTIVSCIKGHPCLIFYSETGAEGSYKYIGKYNLNLDKATPEPFGFDHDDTDFGYLSVGDKYYEIKYADKKKNYANPFVGQLEPAEGADYVPGQVETEKTVEEGQKVNSIHCFEFLDNAVEVCNFLNKKKEDGSSYTFQETWYGTFKNSDNEEVPGWTLGFESRYPEDRVGYHDADMLYPLASWLNELHNLRYGLNGVEADEDKALTRFKNEYQCHLDKNFLLTYYLLTEALLMADSRVKNMMIATWGREKREYIDAEGATAESNNYIFYPIFYDMDTMLGLDNTGVYRFNYYDEDTDASIFNGNEVLWNFVRDTLQSELTSWYTTMENALLSADKILPYFNNNQANMASEAFYNGDALYKYIAPAREGYIDHLHDIAIAPGQAPFLYAAQGDRALMREWFVNNRIKFLRGKYNSNNYQSGDRIEFRWYYPTGQEGDAKLNTSASIVKPDGKFKFTSLKTGYSGVQLGANGPVYNQRFDGEVSKEINLPSADAANGTEAYILGLSNLTELGDLSNKYMQKFIIGSSDVRLKKLILGNPHKDYYNPYWSTAVDGQSPKIGLDGCTYLEIFNLQNCSTYNNTLDFSNSPAIKQILLTGSGVSAITLPANGMLTELRLPTSITVLKINSHSELNDEGFSLGYYEYDPSTNKIGEGGQYVNDFSGLKTLAVVDTPINTYNIVTQAGGLDNYYLKGFNWNITEDDVQYCARSEEQVTLPGDYYYYDSGYKPYTGDTYPAEGRLYEKVTLLEGENIVAIPALDYLYSRSFVEDMATSHGDALSGTITINIANSKVNELAIYEKYKNIYPNVQFKYGDQVTVEGAQRINFYSVDVDAVEELGSLTGIEPMFTTLTANKKYSLAQLIAVDGFNNPNKNATNTKVYEFTGIWQDWEHDKIEYYQDGFFTEETAPDASRLFSKVNPEEAMNLVPKFNALTRYYTVTFYDYDGKVIEALTSQCEYEDILLEHVDNKTELYYLYRTDTTLAENERYTLKGWQTETDFNNEVINPELYDLSKVVVRNNLKLYAYYVKENIETVPMDNRFFTFTNETYNDNKVLTININPAYRYVLEGKITLPNIYEGQSIIAIGDFKDMTKATHVYFANKAVSGYETILDNKGFARSVTNTSHTSIKPAITYVDLPNSIRYIGEKAFHCCTELKQVTLNNNITFIGSNAFSGVTLVASGETSINMQIEINELPTHLTVLGQEAFNRGGDKVIITSIPDGIQKIGARTFANCQNVNIASLGGGTSRLSTIEAQALYNTCSEVHELVIGAGITSLATGGAQSGALANAYSNVVTVTTYSTVYNDYAPLREAGLTKEGYELNVVVEGIT